MHLTSLEEALAGARVLDDEYDDYDPAKARRRIAAEVSRTRWENLFDRRLPQVLAQRYCGDTLLPRPADTPQRRHTPRPAEAAADLHALSWSVIHDPEAASYVARLVNDCLIDPDGALIFACLLDLTQQEEGAQFWWQFAVGAGNATSAYCLHLLHLCRGELGDAAFWADQVTLLQRDPGQYRLRADTVLDLEPYNTCPLHAHEDTALRHTVENLTASCDDDYGLVPQPDPALAEQLEQLATT
ncbi:hypothetical protein [Streptomyces alanosinicus]|uniref:Uncharacterized protein n=1 Tax=Streptomyces alanosinicus TaxID=68171 RepID=A0A918YQC2_9ACTN|nr:hypothetical protein [Streptomyces alanosinicus]GHE11097.1 hypothetical protein GCM10010339_69540 [Streptomyces alanosinicus]